MKCIRSNLTVLLILFFFAGCGGSIEEQEQALQETGSSQKTDSGSQTSSKSLLQVEQFEYLGAFRLPGEGNNGTRFGYGGWAMGLNPDGDAQGSADGYPGSLYIVGHTYQQMVAEVNIPIPKDQRQVGIVGLNTAQYLQNFTDITEGKAASLDQVNGFQINGLAYLPAQGNQSGAKIHWTARPYYNVSLENHLSHGMSNITFNNLDSRGLWRLGDEQAQRTAGYITTIPESFANTYLGGKRLASGLFTQQGVSGTSAGPALYAYAPWQNDPLGIAPSPGAALSVTPLVYYPYIYPEQSNFPDFQIPDGWEAAAWIETENRQGVVVIGSRALGATFYGDARPGDCNIYKGYHGEPYEPRIVFYDPADLALAAQGLKDPTQIVPYLEWSPKEFVVDTCEYYFTGAGFDPNSKRLYVLHRQADNIGGEPQPLVYVFQVKE